MTVFRLDLSSLGMISHQYHKSICCHLTHFLIIIFHKVLLFEDVLVIVSRVIVVIIIKMDRVFLMEVLLFSCDEVDVVT